jgi:hypothetical protein
VTITARGHGEPATARDHAVECPGGTNTWRKNGERPCSGCARSVVSMTTLVCFVIDWDMQNDLWIRKKVSSFALEECRSEQNRALLPGSAHS